MVDFPRGVKLRMLDSSDAVGVADFAAEKQALVRVPSCIAQIDHVWVTLKRRLHDWSLVAVVFPRLGVTICQALYIRQNKHVLLGCVKR